ncbi:MAG TPA: isoprenylcysteine carboxylmethyltransferase family protein [Gemmatimonadales bacterium]|jgi:protein-S-isoprenylcysteine O-methyltransferase Ste14
MVTVRITLDIAIYAVHGAFWAAFGITRSLSRSTEPDPAAAAEPTTSEPATAQPAAAVPTTARFSRLLVAIHAIGFFVMYMGIGSAVFGTGVPHWFTGQQVVGALVIAVGARLMCWALLHFRSWRFQARIESDHELATGGPFALVRHPIYAGLDLLALGSAIWIPTTIMWVAVVLMLLGADIRARAEETVLTEAFGDQYREYSSRVARFIPGIY